MPNASAATTVWNAPNYVGELFLIGANQTPFLNMIGGLNGGKQSNSWKFPINQQYSLESAAQPAITETASLAAPTPVTYVRSQDYNVCQIFQRGISVSYARQSERGLLSGLALGGQQVTPQNELDFQIQANLKQIALDVEHSFINGVFGEAANADQANKTRGLLAAISANAVAAGTTDLSKAWVDTLLRTMAANGADFANMVAFCNAFQMQQLSDIYGYAPDDRNVGGVAIKKIITDFCEIGVVWAPRVPTSTLMLADVAKCDPVFLPVPDKGYLFYEALAKSGASESGQVYGQIGLAYGEEIFHGKITGLTTS